MPLHIAEGQLGTGCDEEGAGALTKPLIGAGSSVSTVTFELGTTRPIRCVDTLTLYPSLTM